ncbi:MAG: HD-GYP domain-containing protein, partial [Burkholderiales bacterium]
RWDGGGYPRGLKGEQIAWPGRVMAIADTFESMTTTQFYRDALSPERAAAEIAAGSGTKYDPTLVEAFQRAFPKMCNVRETYSDLLGDLINLDFTERAQALRRAVARPLGVPLSGGAPARK